MTIADNLVEAFGYLMKDDLEYIRELALTLPESPVIINIGAGTGTSGIAFLETRKDAHVYSIDIIGNVNPFGGLGNEKHAIEQGKLDVKGRYTPICDESINVGEKWDRGLVDMVFIDGNHTYDCCRGDIEKWLPNLKKDGIIALHDYASVWVDVKQSVEDCLEGQYELIGCQGTVIAYRNRKVSEDPS